MQSRSKKPLKTRSGFTLIELMIAIAIFAILVSIATPNAIRWLRNSQFNSAVMDVKNAIEDVRMHAVKNNAQATLTFDGGDAFKTDKNGEKTHELPANTTATPSGFTGGTIRYNSRGMVAENGSVDVNNAGLGLCRRVEVDFSGTTRIVECGGAGG